jgi:phosphoglycerate dehydrogenase-like enzyme
VRVLFHYEPGAYLRRRIAELPPGQLEVNFCSEADEDRFAALIGEAEVIWHVLKPITAAVLAAAPRLKLIQKLGVGVNTIDLEAARRRGVAVCNMPGVNSQAVAELALALMLAAVRRIVCFDGAIRRNEGWTIATRVEDKLSEIAGSTVGLIGAGATARILAPVLSALGARVLYFSRAQKPDFPASWRDFKTLLAESDIVSLHVPLTPQTYHLIDARAIAAMKPGVILINTARGDLIDHAALAAALDEGRVRAVGLDAFAQEPLRSDDPLIACSSAVLTPHVGWLTMQSLDRTLAVAVENCERLKCGAPLLHQVV